MLFYIWPSPFYRVYTTVKIHDDDMRTIEQQFSYKDIEHKHNEYTAKLSNIKAMDT